MKIILKYRLFCLLLLVAGAARSQVDFVFDDITKPDSFSIPFSVHQSLIQVDITLNGKNEKFVLDNGAPYLVMNAGHFNKVIETDTLIKAKGIGGKVDAGSFAIDSFSWQGIEKNNFKAIAADLPLLGDSIAGLLGVNVYRDYKMTFDYDSNRITFVKPIFDTSNNLRAVVTDSLPFALHMPVITLLINGDSLKMGVDCGASTGLLTADKLAVVGSLANFRQTVMTGAGTPAMVVEGDVKEIIIEGVSYKNMKFAFNDASIHQINQVSNIKLDGLLGLPFLMKYKTVIDFPNRRLEIYPEERDVDL